MSNEIQLSVSLACTKLTSETAAVARQQLNVLRNQTGNFTIYGNIQVASSASVASRAAAIPLGGLTPATTYPPTSNAPHYAWFANLGSGAATDTLRIVDLNQSSAVLAELLVGDFTAIPLFGNCAPGVFCASSTQCILEYFITGY